MIAVDGGICCLEKVDIETKENKEIKDYVTSKMRVLVVAWFLSSLIAGIIEEGKMRSRSEHCNRFEGDMRLGSQGWGAR